MFLSTEIVMPGLPQQPGAWRDLAGLACILLAQSPAGSVKRNFENHRTIRTSPSSENVII